MPCIDKLFQISSSAHNYTAAHFFNKFKSLHVSMILLPDYSLHVQYKSRYVKYSSCIFKVITEWAWHLL